MSEQGENQSQPSINLESGNPSSTQNDQNTSGVVLGRKRKCTSDVWLDFTKINVDGEDFAICNTCSSKLKANSKNGTKSLRDHRDRHDKTKSMDIRQQMLRASEKRKDGNVDINNHYFDQEKSRYELACMVILHEYPLSIVNHVGFRKFVSSLQPQFKIPSRNTMKSDIIKIFDCEKAKVMHLMGKLGCRVAITTDMWSSKHTKKGFMAITSHFIDDEWTLHSHIMR